MKKNTAYLVGIKGVGMTALAVYLKGSGFDVVGSDVTDVFPTDKILKDQNIKILKGFSSYNINKKYDVVIVTGAHGGMTNPEAEEAQKLQIPTFMHGEYLGQIMNDKFGISIAGCHGKTTTASIIAFLLEKSGFKPSYCIGTAEINNLGPAGHFSRGKYFVAEADEYMTCPKSDPTPRFFWQKPKIAVITNIEYDHPDEFSGIEEVKDTFLKFINKLDRDTLVVACADSIHVTAILPKINKTVITYGFSPRADFGIAHFNFDNGISFMKVKYKNIILDEYMLSIPGKHNLLNSLAGIVVAEQLGISREKIKKNLNLFTGSKRRFEKIGQIGDILLYDDYAHHPSEITATLSAAKSWFPRRRIIVLFQPHTYSRTKVLFSDFAKAFTLSDLALICDIYPSAREKYDSTVNSNMLVVAANKHKKNAQYLKDKQQVITFLEKEVRPGDLVITMGAGDIYLWHDKLQKMLIEKFI